MGICRFLLLSLIVFQTAGLLPSTAQASCVTGVFAKVFERQDIHQRIAKFLNTPLGIEVTHEYEKGVLKEWPVESARKLYERWKAGDDSVKALFDLGFYFKKSGEEITLVAPDFRSLMIHINDKMISLREEGVKDILSPAIAFVRQAPDGTPEFKFVRMGLDDFYPNEGWELVKNHNQELPLAAWTDAMASGKVIFQIDVMSHDISHVTDYFSNPEKMAAIHAFYKRIKSGEIRIIEKALDDTHLVSFIDRLDFSRRGINLKSAERKLFGRLMIFDEYLSLPDIADSEKIKSLVPHLFENPAHSSVEANREYLLELVTKNPLAFNQQANRISNESLGVLILSGGGARDPYNLERYGFKVNEPDLLKSLGRKDFTRPVFREVVENAAADTLHVALFRIQKINMALQDPEQIKALAKALDLSEVEVTNRLRQFLIGELAPFEVALHQAVALKITPQKIVNEAGAQYMRVDSDTYRYYQSYTGATKGVSVYSESLTRRVFVEPAEP